ncbi:MAG: Fe-S cluster assembly protein SufD [Flavobacteriales bacterium]|nr:Fe-S cluster assembly protein SufD [Flavobacteriales bacterium]
MEVLSATDQKKEAFLKGIAAACETPLSMGATQLREAAMATLESQPVPTTRSEAWKYTRVTRLIGKTWNKGEAQENATEYFVPEVNGWNIVFVNGQFDAAQSTMPDAAGLTVMTMADALKAGKLDAQWGSLTQQQSDWFEALNMAFATDGLYIHLEAKTAIDRPIYLLHLTTGDATAVVSRNFIQVEKGANLTVVQHAVSAEGTSAYVNIVNEHFVADNAQFNFEKIQDEAGEIYHHSTEWAEQTRDSRYDIRSITLQGHWVRNNLNIRVNGENCSTNLYGSYMPNGKEHIDNHTMVDHLIPHCESNEVYKGIVNDKSTAVFNGKVFVRPDAQKTNAFQQNANIVLSDDAEMYSKPELEIYADDVKCSHGSTTGQFDEEAVYYLRARGIGEQSARMLLVQAFVADVMDAISNDALRDYCLNKLQERASA